MKHHQRTWYPPGILASTEHIVHMTFKLQANNAGDYGIPQEFWHRLNGFLKIKMNLTGEYRVPMDCAIP